MPGSTHTISTTTYTYSELFDYADLLYEPSEIPVLTNPEKPATKFKFTGWFTDPECNTQVSSLTNSSYYQNKEYETNPELVLYAGWVPVP